MEWNFFKPSLTQVVLEESVRDGEGAHGDVGEIIGVKQSSHQLHTLRKVSKKKKILIEFSIGGPYP